MTAPRFPGSGGNRRRFLFLAVAGLVSGCRNPDAVRVLMEGPEGSGIMGTKFFKVLAVYQASAAQKKQAEAAARAAETRIVAAARARAAAPPAAAEPTPAERAALPPVLAVPVTEERKQGASTVMLWDTRTAALADANVYDLQKEPPAGKTLTWKTSVASIKAVYAADDWPN